MDKEASLCTVCNHHHHQHEKCPQCGHKGKGKIFRLLAEGYSSNLLNQKCFDKKSAGEAFGGLWMLSHIIRRRVFCDELGGTEELEFDKFDSICRHLIVQGKKFLIATPFYKFDIRFSITVGDAPVGCARWRFETSLNNEGTMTTNAVLDRLCILSTHRRQGYSRFCMDKAIEDVLTIARSSRVDVKALLVPIPPESLLQQKLILAGFKLYGQQFEHKGILSVCMQLDLNSRNAEVIT